MSLSITPSRILFYALLALIALSPLVALTVAVAGRLFSALHWRS